MNQRNIEALARYLAAMGAPCDHELTSAEALAACREMAETLAGFGVLAVAALTNDALEKFGATGVLGPIADGYAGDGGVEEAFDQFREGLTRLARGEG